MTPTSSWPFEPNRSLASPKRWVVLVASFLLIAMQIVACQSGPRIRYRHEYEMNTGDEHHSGLTTALVVPIDALNESPVKGIDFANDRIGAMLVEYVGARGIETWPIDPFRLQEIARAGEFTSRRKARASEKSTLEDDVGLSELVPELISRLDKEPDLVIVPSLVVRNAVYKGKRQIVWDGVKRRETSIMVPGGRPPAVTIEIEVYARDGKRLFHGYGGIEQIFYVDMSTSKYEQRKNLYEDEDNVREGICVAFYPWFGLDEACVR